MSTPSWHSVKRKVDDEIEAARLELETEEDHAKVIRLQERVKALRRLTELFEKPSPDDPKRRIPDGPAY